MSRAEILRALRQEGRLDSLRETGLLDAEPERAFDRLTRLAVRLVAVADVFDALTHRRPYKPAWPPEEAAAEIEKLSGTLFDPAVVEGFRAARREILAVVEVGPEAGG